MQTELQKRITDAIDALGPCSDADKLATLRAVVQKECDDAHAAAEAKNASSTSE